MKHLSYALGLTATLVLAACDREAPPEPRPTSAARATSKSIFRPEFQVAPAEEEALKPLQARILFPQGAELTEPARAELAEIVASPQFTAGGAIVLRGHSDAGGGDDINFRISQERAEAVRDWLIEKDVPGERIEVIAFGEQNPVAPNARPDGSPNEEGRAKNRRVDITIAVAAPPPTEEPSLAETLAETEAEEPAKAE